MRTLCCLAGIAVLAAAPITHSQEVDLILNFDGLAAGTEANAALPAGYQVRSAVYDFAYDAFGEPITGTQRWRPDPSGAPVLVDNPELYGRAAAPSPSNAMEALFQPVLLTFEVTSQLVRFAVTLDLDSFGDNGTLPGYEDIAVQLLGKDGVPIETIPVDQTTPGFFIEVLGPLAGVREIVFPAGAFYDDLQIRLIPDDPSGSVIPEGKTWFSLFGLLGAVGWSGARRYRASRS
ncbi:MAG: hypothetical protein JNK85_04150 [Verrucomicrobiales bacterium]|nr:hypothetical protein [Verrucomicrobiales bacterium]